MGWMGKPSFLAMYIEDGSRTENTSGAEGWKEEVRQEHLQSKKDTSTGKNPREKVRCIYFENATGIYRPLYLKNIETREELMDAIFTLYPGMNSHMLGFRISPQRMGAINRVYIENKILEEYDNLYVHLYIRKHS